MISTWPSPQNVAYTLDISENTCVSPAYTTEVIANCSGGEGDYSVNVDVSDIGSFNDFNLSDGTSTISVQEAEFTRSDPTIVVILFQLQLRPEM